MSKTKCLVVDDQKVMRNMIKKMLDPEKFDIVEASNGKEALEVLGSDADISLVISDINMPVMDGLELLDRRKELEHHQNTDFVVITSIRTDSAIQQVQEKGAAGWLTKPFKKEQLDELLGLLV